MTDGASKLQLQHLSMRVPWHDDKWRGTICNHPAENASCLILKNVHQNRDDARETADASKSFEDLDQSDFPACIGERAGFMAPFAMWRKITHPHSTYSPPHKLFKPLFHKHAAYSADAIPFRWMLASNAQDIAEDHDVSIEPDLEDKAQEFMGFPTNWIEHGHNQRALLNTFLRSWPNVEPPYVHPTPLSCRFTEMLNTCQPFRLVAYYSNLDRRAIKACLPESIRESRWPGRVLKNEWPILPPRTPR